MNSNPIDINEKKDGQNIIFRRVEEVDYAAVEALLNAGVDINIRGFQGMTPAIWAAAGNSWRMVKLLIGKGADLTVSVRNGMSLSSLAKTSQERLKLDTAEGRALLEVIEILKQRGLW